MNLVILFFAITFNVLSNEPSAVAPKPGACEFFSKANAVLLLGGNLKAEEREFREDSNYRHWGCLITKADSTSDQSPKLHFLLIRSKTEALAIEDFASIKRSNEKHQGFELWPGVGDEAIVHTDGSNFQLVIVRKGANSIRIKLNPMTGVDLEAVKAVAAELAAKL